MTGENTEKLITLNDVYKISDQLTTEQQEQVRAYIEQQQSTLRREINAILQDAPAPELPSGTMDADKLMRAVEGMWVGLGDHEIEAIVQAMNEETIKPSN